MISKFLAHRANQQDVSRLEPAGIYRQLDCRKITALRPPRSVPGTRADTDPPLGLFPELSVVSLARLRCIAALSLRCSIKQPVGNPARYEETYQTSNPA
jgi:hypothetical protein